MAVVLVADKAFVSPATSVSHRLESVFPMSNGDGAYRATLDSLVHRSVRQSAFYEVVLPSLLPAMERHMTPAGAEVACFVRPVLVTTTTLFLDRCIRVLHRLRQHRDRAVGCATVEPVEDIQWISDIQQSWRINQEIIQRIVLALGREAVPIFAEGDYPEYPIQQEQRNLVFAPQPYGISGLVAKLAQRYYNGLQRLPQVRARVQGSMFGPDRYYLARRGVLGPFGFMRKPVHFELRPGVRDRRLRDTVFREVESILLPGFESLLAAFLGDMPKAEVLRLGEAYVALFVDWFPAGYLEGLPGNLERARVALQQRENSGALIGDSLASDRGRFEVAAARLAGRPVIGTQHGGHYGYTEDYSFVGQMEYSLYDKMVTWGWTNIDPHLPQCETIPLPSPKLSERPLKTNHWRRVSRPSAKMRDVLFLSNLFHRFPYASTSGHARVDFLDEITSSQEEMMRALGEAKLTVDHKPYSMKFVRLYAAHYDRLAAAGGAGYRLLESTHKGLTVAMVRGFRILLWDQIGTGTLECLTSGVPCIVYWKRIYSRESSAARELVASLERCGVVHADAGRLAEEVRIYLADPERWMTDRARKHAISEFCRNFALTDPRWPDSWKRQLS